MVTSLHEDGMALQAKLLSMFYVRFPDASLNALATQTR
jgi:hypothetical protein